MNAKEKGKFNEALKLFDNKEYKNSKKACDKILEKQPNNEDALALKGLVMAHLNEKEEGIKLINQSLKINMKNPNSWHFFALLHKEDKNYAQALKCYLLAYKNDPNNFNVIRDLSYLQLYLRQYSNFADSARKGVDSRPHMIVNWITYAFAAYLIGNYEMAIKLLETTEKINSTGLKKQEKNEIVLFQIEMYIKMKKYKEGLEFIEDNKDCILDKTFYIDKAIELALKAEQKEKAIEFTNMGLSRNPENVSYFISYFNAHRNLNIKTHEELLSITDEQEQAQLMKILEEDLKPRIKSRIMNRLELAFSNGGKFKEIFNSFFVSNVELDIVSIFQNVKFIYLHQKNKIQLVEEVLKNHLDNITPDTKASTKVWVYYFAAQHYDFLRDCEKALHFINLAIDSTPTVVEFYMVKARIFKHSGHLLEASSAMEKAKKLDLGDRYLNAKQAKVQARLCDVSTANETMKEFVREPLSDENMDHFQCMWFETECGNAYLKEKKILHAHRLFKSIVSHFSTIIEDQFDFYNYALRRFMLNDFYRTLEYMDRVIDNKYIHHALIAYEYILQYLKDGRCSEKELHNEFEEMQKEKLEKYKFKGLKELINEIDNDMFNLCLKLQSHAENLHVHYIAVKIFLKRGKLLLAVKSLKKLEQINKTSFEFLDSVHKLQNYLKETKVNSDFLEIVYDQFCFLKEEELCHKHMTEVKEVMLKTEHPHRILINDIHVNMTRGKQSHDLIEDFIANNSKTLLRGMKYKNLNFIEIYLSLFCSKEKKIQTMEKYASKIKLECEEKDIKHNLTFFE